MSAVAKLIEDMIMAGVSADLIGRTAALLAEREAVLVPDEQAERRRAKDRERKRLRNSAESAELQAASSLKDPHQELTNVQVSQNPPPPYSPPAARRFDDWPDDFADQLWAAFPRKTEKKAGMEALTRLHRLDRVSWGDLMRGVQALDDCDPQFVPALARWVKGERWKDERPAPGRAPPFRQARRNTALDDLNDRAEGFFANVQHFPRIAG